MPYLLRDGTIPGVALYSRCEDLSYAQAELFVMLDRVPPGKAVFGFADKDPSYSVRHFLHSYRNLSGDRRRLKELRSRILFEGWPYQDVEVDDKRNGLPL